MCCDWMLEYIEARSELEYKSPLLFKRSDFTALAAAEHVDLGKRGLGELSGAALQVLLALPSLVMGFGILYGERPARSRPRRAPQRPCRTQSSASARRAG